MDDTQQPTPTLAAQGVIAELQRLYQRAANSSSFYQPALDCQYEKYRRRFEAIKCDDIKNDGVFQNMKQRLAEVNDMASSTIMVKTYPKAVLSIASLSVAVIAPTTLYVCHKAIEHYKKREEIEGEEGNQQHQSDASQLIDADNRASNSQGG